MTSKEGFGEGISPFRGWVTACIPHFNCHRYVRRAVESLLSQTYPWVRIIVINDGQEDPPWSELSDIGDPRVLRFELEQRAGPYFALEVARSASPDPFFLIQDADDWSTEERTAALLAALAETGADYAVSAQPQFAQDEQGELTPVGARWTSVHDGEWGTNYAVNNVISEHFLYRAPHHGLFTADILRRIGSYYGGQIITWDTMITNLVLMLGSIAWTPLPLYNRLIRPTSLTHAESTGVHSAYQRQVRSELGRVYAAAFAEYERFKNGEISRADVEASIRSLCASSVPPAQQMSLAKEGARLKAQILEMNL